MLNFATSTSVVPFEYSGGPPLPSVFALAKQAMKRGTAIAGAATWTFTKKHKYNVAVWGTLLATVGYIFAYDAFATHRSRDAAVKLGASIEAEVDASMAWVRESMQRTAQHYEAVVQRDFDPAFNLALWTAAVKAPTKPVAIAISFTHTQIPPLLERVESLPVAVTSAPLIDAAHVRRVMGDAKLAAQFAAAEKKCRPVAAGGTLTPDCQRVMNPLYKMLGDVAVALAKQDSTRALAAVATERQYKQTAAVVSVVKSKPQAAKFVSAPKTKLRMIEQPRRDETNHPVRVAKGKTKRDATRDYSPVVGSAEFWQKLANG